ncbi:MAG: endopeptidase La [Candidatus Glassbacteria bacterium]
MKIKTEREGELLEIEDVLPVIPLRDVVIYPNMVVPLLVGREASIAALEDAMLNDKLLFLTPQLESEITDPEPSDLYDIGTVSRILQMVRLPNGTIKVLVEGIERATPLSFSTDKDFLKAHIELFPMSEERGKKIEAIARRAMTLFEEYIKLNKRLPDELLTSLQNVASNVRLMYLISSHILLKLPDKVALLEIPNLYKAFEAINRILVSEIEILKLERKIEGEVKNQVLKNQKEFYLQEQLKAIYKELGDVEDQGDEIIELQEKAEKVGLPREVREKAEKEIKKLSKMAPLSPEATVIRNYLDWILGIPWKKKTKDNLSVEDVARILDEDHYGLEKAKERIIEYIAVLKLVGKMKGPILCFVGPPGVGKTSLARSIARALSRKFVRISLGGIRDEAEIRGHRKTYIGALPGRLIQAMRKAGTINPVMLLDEVDKMSVDFRGDPSAALLEALDPEQNHVFSDHYLEVDYDLSKVMFITTANVLYSIHPALKDRMEIIRLPGYLENEKIEIAKRFLIPKQFKSHGLDDGKVHFTRNAISTIINRYTREAGVRNLEREISTICRKIAKKVAVKGSLRRIVIGEREIPKLLGISKYLEAELEKTDEVGVATGLAWTESGGEILSIEVSVVPGKGNLTLTGKLGDVMKESAEAALSYIRSRSKLLGLEDNFHKKYDVHVHIPEGATPKDGPSAGIAIATALISALIKHPVKRDVALTGEITLRGRVLPIGGLKEKSVAAMRAGANILIIPEKNRKDVEDLPPEVRKKMKIILVSVMDEVLSVAIPEITRREGKRKKVSAEGEHAYPH